MMGVIAVFIKELMSFFFTPMVYILWAVFLFLNSWAFVQIIAVLNSPEGAVSMYPIEVFFGGTIYFWLNLFVLIPLLTMRTISQERRLGSFEIMLTAPLGELQFVLGKFLAVMFILKVFWLSSCIYPIMLGNHIHIHIPAIIVAFLGTMLVCAAFSALGIAVSSISSNSLLSAFLSFVLIIVLFTIGVFSRFLVGKVASVFSAISLLERFQPFGSGVIDLASVVYFLSLTWAFLEFAVYWLKFRIKQQRSLRLFLIVFILVGINIIAVKHDRQWNFSSQNFSSLSERTKLFLKHMKRDVDIYVCLSKDLRIYNWMKDLLKNCQKVNSHVKVHWVDPIKDYQQVKSLMHEYGINPADTIIVKGPVKFEIIRQYQLVEMDYSGVMQGHPPKPVGFSGESRLLSALISVTRKKRILVRWITGHGEFLPNEEIRGRRFSLLASVLASQGMSILVSPILSKAAVSDAGEMDVNKFKSLEVHLKKGNDIGNKRDKSSGSNNEVMLLASPASKLLDQEKQYLVDFVKHGGKVFCLLDVGCPDEIREFLKREFKVEVGDDIVVDPVSNVNSPINLFVSFYGKHPITLPLIGRAMLLPQACSVDRFKNQENISGAVEIKVYPLLFTSRYAWADVDWRSGVLKYNPDKEKMGQISLAVAVEAGKGRMVVVGDADFAANDILERLENKAFVLSAFDWLTGQEGIIGLPPKQIKTIQLTLSSRQIRDLVLISMLGLPIIVACFGLIVWLWRRRK